MTETENVSKSTQKESVQVTAMAISYPYQFPFWDGEHCAYMTEKVWSEKSAKWPG